MPERGPVHIATAVARASGHRIGHTTRCGVPLVDAAFYYDVPTNEDLIDDTCNACLEHAREEKRNAQAARPQRKAATAAAKAAAARRDRSPEGDCGNEGHGAGADREDGAG